ncbi:DUF5336 domain-containing protein [Gordonia neofelifaecis]|uniref:Uncharacterized protein n=1 Tax=Gordonia neofelifaecis NRRL B-59395 TaxID=644548 RepID=F1YKL6_9ACTN|nr:DUF5336 domain-containing protein [Gordonia neofelifaecis]EGD54660.1 hypothetical protein SCNU_12247 [Gordonia neofelifaecis NRRL B-59395]
MTNPQYPGQPDPDATTTIGQSSDPASTTGQWTAANPMPGYAPQPAAPTGPLPPGPPPAGPYGAPGYPQPARPPLLSRLPMPVILALGSAVAGVVTFFMGFLGWVTVSETIERKADDWAADMNGSFDIPAYLSPSLILSPGWFFLLLGTIGVAAAGLIAPKWRRFLPYLAFLAVFGWLGLFVCALGLPPFLSLGAGAYVALTVGFIQAALLAVAAVLDGMAPTPPEPFRPGPMGPPRGY